MTDYSAWHRAASGLRLPAALVDLDAFDRNLRSLAALSGGKPIRLATKSVRVPELIRRALAYGAPFRGLMCYSAEEARFLSEQGFDDLLVAYPTLQKSDLEPLAELAAQGRKVALVVDSREGIEAASRAVRDSSKPLRVVIEVDASLRLLGLHLGVRRSPVRSAADLDALIAVVRATPGVRFSGLMSYEAQVAGLGDRNPFKPLLNPLAALVRKLSVKSVARSRQELASRLRGVEDAVFNGGGTGSLDSAAREPWLTELSAGSGLFAPHLFDYYSNIRFEPAAFFGLQVVRGSDPDHVTCQGGGYIASGEPGWDRVPVPAFPPGLKLVSSEGCGEVQTPLRGVAVPHLGGTVLFRHAKAGELMERFNEVWLLQDGKIAGSAKTYRGMGRCFF